MMMRKEGNGRRVIDAAVAAAAGLAIGACGDGGNSERQDGAKPAASEEAEKAMGDSQQPIGKFEGLDVSQLSRNPGAAMAAMGFPSNKAEARSFRRLSDEDLAAFEGLVARFYETDDAKARIAILEELEEYYGEAIMGVVADALESPDEGVRFEAVEALAGNVSQQILQVLAAALEDESAHVRIGAIHAVTQVRDPAVVDFVVRGFEDEEAGIRQETFVAIDSLMEDYRVEALDRAFDSRHPEVVSGAIGELQALGARRAVETLFQGIDSSDPGVKAEATFAVSWLIDEEFETTAAARTWWAEHKNEFDSDLQRKE